MSGIFDAFLSKAVSDCVNARYYPDKEQEAKDEGRLAVEHDEEMERRGRFAFDAGDDWRAE